LHAARFAALRNGTEIRTPIVNSRNALRNAQALVGLRAFVRGLAMEPASGHRESEDRPDPGGRRV
jgi:hypothetical protein